MRLDQVAKAARQRAAAVTAEAAGYLVLLTMEHLAPMGASVALQQVSLQSDGSVRLSGATPVEESEAVRRTRALLADLLDVARFVSPSLGRIAQHSQAESFEQLRAELTSALVPLNAAAAQRGLSRLWRETERAVRNWPPEDEPPPAPPRRIEAAPRPALRDPSTAPPSPTFDVRRAVSAPAIQERVVADSANPGSVPVLAEASASDIVEVDLDVPLDIELFDWPSREPEDASDSQLSLFTEAALPRADRPAVHFPASESGCDLVVVPTSSSVPAGPRSDFDDLLSGFLAETR